MRVIFLPTNPEAWIGVLVILVLVVGIVLWQRFRPSASRKALEDARCHQALAVYVDSLPGDDPTREERRDALAAATLYLVKEHGVASAEAAANMRLVVAAYDKEQSYDLRHTAIDYEEAGEYEQAIAHFARAARLQEEHDPADYQFLQQSIARVRAKAR